MSIVSALRLARKSRHKMHKHAALVFRGGAIVSFGTNNEVTHAEVRALKKLSKEERKGTRVFCIRLRRDGFVGLARPCPSCQVYMYNNGIKSASFTDGYGHVQFMTVVGG